MGLNAFFSYTVCGAMGYSWQAALAAVFISGIFFILLTATGLRQKIVSSIPMSLKRAICAGIGLFIAVIGFVNAGLIKMQYPLVAMGDIGTPTALLAILGLVLIIALLCMKVKGALFIGIIATSAVGVIMQFVFKVELNLSTPGFTEAFGETFGEFASALGQCFTGFGELFSTGEGFGAMIISAITVLVVMTLTDMFDTVGTLVGCAEKGGFLDKDGNLPRAGQAMMADALTTSTGAILGTSTVTTYIESSAGISEGGKTGLTSMFTGTLFILALLFAPVMGLIPASATAPALVIVGIMMMSTMKDIKWGDMMEAIPCFVTAVMMPFTYSIADGIGLGFIFYTLVKIFTGKLKEVHPLLVVFALFFMLKYVLKALGLF
jgi:AGZA family xanthine/uracil permease-like MFS transporter